MKKIFKVFLIIVGFTNFIQVTLAQIVINSLPSTYTQTFDSLGINNIAWMDNVTLPGWVLIDEGGTIFELTVSDGSDLAATIHNYGTTGNPERSLGSLAAPGNASFYGLRFINLSASIITNMKVTYDGEQWSIGQNNNALPDRLRFFYRVGGTDFLADTNHVGWTIVTALDFASPQNPIGFPTFQVLNGNNPVNRVANIMADIPVTIVPGQEVWLRWFDRNEVFDDHALAIDNVSVQFQAALLDATVELDKPKLSRTLNFKGSKGFPFRALIKTSSTVSSVSYLAFSGTNAPTNMVFEIAGQLKEFRKGKKFQQGYRYMATNKGNANKPGIGIGAGASNITLMVRVQGSNGGANNTALSTNFIFSNVKVK